MASSIPTPREVQIVEMSSRGMTCKAIAAELGISPHTVTAHRYNLHAKLDVHTGAHALRKLIEMGLLKFDATSEGTNGR